MQPLDEQSKDQVAERECAALVIETALLTLRTIRREMRSDLPMDVSLPQFRVLAYLAHHEGASLSDLADHIGLTLPSMSKAVDALVKRDFVKREASPDDRRRVTLCLTPGGLQAFHAAADATQARVAEMLASLTGKQRSKIAKAMRVLRTVFAPNLESVS